MRWKNKFGNLNTNWEFQTNSSLRKRKCASDQKEKIKLLQHNLITISNDDFFPLTISCRMAMQ